VGQAVNVSLFVYGTLKPGEMNYADYLAGRTLYEQPAWVVGAVLYTAGPFPYLVLGNGLAQPTEYVYGMLLTICPEVYMATLQALDDLEGYQPGAAGNLYERITHTVQTAGAQVAAWMYVAGLQPLTAIRAGQFHKIPGGNWNVGWR